MKHSRNQEVLRSWERCLGNPAPQIFYCDDFFFFFFFSLSHVFHVRNKELCLLSKKLHPIASMLFLVFPCVFFTKIHHAGIVLSTKYLRAAVHSLHCLLWNELSPFSLWHKNLSRVSSCHLWSPSSAGQVLSPVQWNDGLIVGKWLPNRSH